MIEEESHSHPHHTGRPWLDLIVAGSAIFISVISLIVSIEHGRTMEKLVAANEKQVEASTLPILRFSHGNMLDNNVPAIHFDLRNGGTGPAIIEWFRLKWNGQPANGPLDLLDRCCSAPPHKNPVTSWDRASGMTLAAGQRQIVFQIPGDGTDRAWYSEVNAVARFQVRAEACFCSVLKECWITDFVKRPRNVEACEAIPDSQRW